MLLAIDTSTKLGSVARVERSGAVVEAILEADHAASLAPAVERLIPDPSLVEGYAIAIGPGSFTGLRIGIAFLKGLAFVHRRLAAPVSTLELMALGLAAAHPGRDAFLPILDARRGEVYAALYRRSAGGVAVDAALPEAVYARAALVERASGAGAVAGGDGIALDFGPIPPWALADPSSGSPRASALGRIGQARLDAGQGVDPSSLEPAYLRPSGAELTLGILAPQT